MQDCRAAQSIHENLIIKVKKNCGSDPEIFPDCLGFEFVSINKVRRRNKSQEPMAQYQ